MGDVPISREDWLKLKRYPYFRLYVADIVSDALVEAMSTEQVGAYFLLLCKAWGQPIVGTVPDDDRVLARWARVPLARWRRIKARVLAPWKLIDGVWHQKRMQLEYIRLVGQSDAQSTRALKRWGYAVGTAGGKPELSPDDAGPMPDVSPLEPEAELEAKEESSTTNAREKSADFSTGLRKAARGGRE
jgi:uncharacterized protein YdaU (DUF1376 family)